jgi:drug/metabolite transporter (DMT)-like permease
MNWLIHHTKRVLRITGGILLLLLGLVMMVPGIPGPGFLLILLGLSILAVDYVWAHRLNVYLKDKAAKVLSSVKKRFRKDEPAKKV